MGFYTEDRRAKYGNGLLRLGLLTLGVGWYIGVHPSASTCTSSTPSGCSVGGGAATPAAVRCLPFVYFGLIGAVINVDLLGRAWNLGLLAVGALLVGLDIAAWQDAAVVVYLLKTALGDVIAGKLDTLEWALFGLFSAALGLAGLVLQPAVLGPLQPYARIFACMFAIQLVSELGDNHLEQYKFFRHRYCFELLTVALLALLPQPTGLELAVVWFDLVACTFYRVSNYAIIVRQQVAGDGFFSRFVVDHATALASLVVGRPMVVLHHPKVAAEAMRQSSCKGVGIERYLACPAWQPLVSLESIDGPLWVEMRTNLRAVLKAAPGVDEFKAVATDRLAAAGAACRDGAVLDANGVARLTLAVFIEYLFGRPWCDEFEVLVEASWEWRREIAQRGTADPEVKRRAVALLVDDLIRGSRYWGLFGEAWREPAKHSLFMQPFLISPCINSGDLAVAFVRHPSLSMDAALREMHPFPVLERLLEADLAVPGHPTVPKGTQVFMLPAEWRGSADWPVFGAGRRLCAGVHLARPWLDQLRTTLLACGARAQPELNHRYSGRHNDSNLSVRETVFTLTRIASAIARAGLDRWRPVEDVVRSHSAKKGR